MNAVSPETLTSFTDRRFNGRNDTKCPARKTFSNKILLRARCSRCRLNSLTLTITSQEVLPFHDWNITEKTGPKLPNPRKPASGSFGYSPTFHEQRVYRWARKAARAIVFVRALFTDADLTKCDRRYLTPFGKYDTRDTGSLEISADSGKEYLPLLLVVRLGLETRTEDEKGLFAEQTENASEASAEPRVARGRQEEGSFLENPRKGSCGSLFIFEPQQNILRRGDGSVLVYRPSLPSPLAIAL